MTEHINDDFLWNKFKEQGIAYLISDGKSSQLIIKPFKNFFSWEGTTANGDSRTLSY